MRRKYADLPLTAPQQKLVEDNLGLARAVSSALAFRLAKAMRAFGKARPAVRQFYDEILEGANLGLVEAARRYDPERGFRFSTYAWPWIRREGNKAALHLEMIEGPKYRRRHCRRIVLFHELERTFTPIGREDFVKVEVYDPRGPLEPETPATALPEEILVHLRRLLTERNLRVFLGYTVQRRSQEAMSKQEGVTKQRVHQIAARSLEILKADPAFCAEMAHRLVDRRQHLCREDFTGTGVATLLA